MNFGDVPGYFDFHGVYSTMVDECPNGGILVEVGCWLGRSVIYLAEKVRQSGKDITVFAVDTWHGSDQHSDADKQLMNRHHGAVWHEFLANVKACGVRDIIVPMCLPSVESARYFYPHEAFMVYIDALHTYEAVRADIAAWRSKVVPGGYLAGHDYGWNGPDKVKRAVDEAFPNAEIIGPTWKVRL